VNWLFLALLSAIGSATAEVYPDSLVGTAGPSWSVQWSTTTPASNAFSTIATTNTSQGFVRLIGPNGQSSVGGIVLTITNAQGMLSNGVLTGTLHLGTNAWQAAFGQPGTTRLQYRITIAP
jgi:hypothetical protein